MSLLLSLLFLAQEMPPPIEADPDAVTRIPFEEPQRDPVTGELPVDPYIQDDENAGADPFKNGKMAAAFHGQDGIRRIADNLVDISLSDPRISDIFKAHDTVRLRRTLFEQFCFILNAGCDYSGRDMKTAHTDMGLQRGDLNALVENLQKAMDQEGIAFRSQNRLLSKLAPMNRDIVER